MFSLSSGELGRNAVMKHHINTGDAQPVHLLHRRIPQARRDEVKRLIQEMLDQGAIQHSDSPCSETYPIHAVFNSHPAPSQGTYHILHQCLFNDVLQCDITAIICHFHLTGIQPWCMHHEPTGVCCTRVPTSNVCIIRHHHL